MRFDDGSIRQLLAFVYLFSVGDAFRAGVQQRNPWTPILIAGYVLIAFAELSILAPIYCLFLFLNRAKISNLNRSAQSEASGA
jgi:hypothetical protein